MTVDGARRWIIIASLFVTGTAFVFFLVAPAIGYPLTWEQGVRLFEIILPVFLAYLGSATHFLFHARMHQRQDHLENAGQFLGLLVKGPILVFGIATIALLFAFGYSNRSSAPAGEGMTIDMLSSSFTAALGILAVTTNVAVSYLFALESKRR